MQCEREGRDWTRGKVIGQEASINVWLENKKGLKYLVKLVWEKKIQIKEIYV